MTRLTLLLLGLCLLGMPIFALGENTPTPIAPSRSEAEYLNEANINLLAGDYEAAADTLTAMLDQYPDNAEAYFLRGYSYQAQARATLALDDFTRAIQLMPYAWEFYLARGDVFATLQELENVFSDYRTALDLNPMAAETYYRLADLYAVTRDEEKSDLYRLMGDAAAAYNPNAPEQMVRLVNQALEEIRNDNKLKAYAYYLRAMAAFAERDFNGVVRDVSAATEYYADMHNLYLLRGSAYRMLGDLEAAGRDYYRRITLLEDEQRQRVMLDNEGISNMAYGVVDVLEMTCPVGSTADVYAMDANSSGVDALIAILDPQDNPIAGDDDRNAENEDWDAFVGGLPIEQAGTYTILVSHANGGYTGEVMVLYECNR